MDVVTELAGYEVVYANGTYTLALSDEVVKIYIKYHDEPVIPGLTAADDDYLYYVEVAAGEDLVLTMPEAKGIFVLEAYNSEDDSYTTTNSKADGTVTMPWEVISDEGVEYLWLAHYPNKVTVNLNGGSLSDDTMVWFYDYGGELAEDGKSATMYYPIHNWIMLEYELEWSTFVKEGCTLIGFRLNGGTEIVDRFECVDGLVVDLVWQGGCEAMIGGEAFETLEEAIEAAEKGDIVRLCADVSVDELALFNGIILDLDGHTLNVAKYITVYADNHIVDYEGGGEGGGGSGGDSPEIVLTVPFDPNAGIMGEYGTPDKTFAEVDEAMQAGKRAILRFDYGNNFYRYVAGYGSSAMPGLIEFTEVYWGFGQSSPANMTYSAYRYSSDNEFTEYRKDVFIAYTE
jgi:hypothetical protein